jgi:hypothetical protein
MKMVKNCSNFSIDLISSTDDAIDLFLTEEIIDRSICLGQFFIFLGSTLNSVNDQIALNVFSGLI